MMADHWKSIANRLGAPGVDEPEVETQAAEPAPGSVRPSSALPNLPIPDEALSFKSSRPSPAQNELAQPPESRTTTTTPSTPLPAARSFSEPSPPSAAEARREAPRMPDRFEPETPPAAPPETPPKRKSSWESLANMFNIKVDRSKPAEAVPETTAIATPPSQFHPVRPAAAADDRPFSIFSDERSPRSNPALDAMFGDAPQGSSPARSDEWGKPRVIDDLGWASDDDKPAPKRGGFVESDEAHSDATPSSIHESNAEGGDEEAPRRGRRRRGRRGGRGDSGGETSASSQPRSAAADRPSAERSSGWGGLDDTLENEDELSVGDDPWGEPESFEDAQLGVRDEFDEDSDGSAEELSADGEILRRSSRRRRRGRGRGERDREQGEMPDEIPAARPAGRGRSVPARPSSAPRDADDLSAPVGFRSDRDDEDFSDTSDRLDAPRPASSSRPAEARRDGRDSEEPGSRPRRRRRGGSSSSSEKSSDSRREGSSTGRGRSAEGRSAEGRSAEGQFAGRPSDSEGPIEDDFDDISLGPAFDGEEDDTDHGDGQHRSIPTWADSIQSLVEVNMENRKRGGDSRGGAPRGRPRGRR